MARAAPRHSDPSPRQNKPSSRAGAGPPGAALRPRRLLPAPERREGKEAPCPVRCRAPNTPTPTLQHFINDQQQKFTAEDKGSGRTVPRSGPGHPGVSGQRGLSPAPSPGSAAGTRVLGVTVQSSRDGAASVGLGDAGSTALRARPAPAPGPAASSKNSLAKVPGAPAQPGVPVPPTPAAAITTRQPTAPPAAAAGASPAKPGALWVPC